jgi:holo-[acyl-carrier protein] synthase
VVLGLGLDVVDVSRVARLIERHGDRAVARIFTVREADYCARSARAAERFAARFAAKEAAVKALGTGVAGGVSLRDVEVAADAAGRPSLMFSGKALEALLALGATRAHVSLTHDAGVAAAAVILEG